MKNYFTILMSKTAYQQMNIKLAVITFLNIIIAKTRKLKVIGDNLELFNEKYDR